MTTDTRVVVIDYTPYGIRRNEEFKSVAVSTRPTPEELEKVCARAAIRFGDQLVALLPREGCFERFRILIHKYSQRKKIIIPDYLNSEFWSDTAKYYHGNIATLATCIREFRDLNPDLEDRLIARASCFVVSVDFFNLLIRRGVVSLEQIASGEAQVLWRGEDTGHADTRIGRLVIDWTYRQLDSKCPVPYVYVDKTQPVICRLP